MPVAYAGLLRMPVAYAGLLRILVAYAGLLRIPVAYARCYSLSDSDFILYLPSQVLMCNFQMISGK